MDIKRHGATSRRHPSEPQACRHLPCLSFGSCVYMFFRSSRFTSVMFGPTLLVDEQEFVTSLLGYCDPDGDGYSQCAANSECKSYNDLCSPGNFFQVLIG